MAPDDPGPRPTAFASSPSTAAQTELLAGRYELAEQIGAGGMGVVRRARDTVFNRDVAIKLLKAEVSADSLAATRFRVESAITGQLQHPGIPPAYDLGTLPNGQPFLAMKLVKGATLRDLLKHRQSPADGLGRFIAIFEQVCHAVGYAHARGIVHRDLKPSNVMVGTHGEVQVMDWGLAKVLPDQANPQLALSDDTDPYATVTMHAQVGPSEASGSEPRSGSVAAGAGESRQLPGKASASETRTGSVLGTPAYMGPEQAAGEVRKLNPRSDVFGLGAMLCEILTGDPPYRGQGSNQVWVQAARGETADAFTRLDSCGAEPELVALCKRCLAFDQQQRPADGTAVARQVAEIREMAEARARQAELEQQQALVREAEGRKRRRVVLGAGAAIVLVLLAGLAASLWQMQRALDAERQARTNARAARQAEALANKHAADALRERDARAAALKAEQQARQLAERRQVEAETNLRYARTANEILGSVFTGLDPEAQYETVGDLRHALADTMKGAVEQLQGSSIGDPLVVAAMQNTLGQSLLALGDHPSAITLFERALATRTAKLGSEHPDTLGSMNNLAAAYQAASRLEEALALLEEALRLGRSKLGSENPATLASMNNLARAYQAAGRLDEALPLFEQALALSRTRLGPEHPRVLQSMNNLALAYKTAGRLKEALPLYEAAMALSQAQLGPQHPDTLATMNNLAGAYQAAGRLDEAVPLYEQTLMLRKAALGPLHPDTLTTMSNLASAYYAVGLLAEAVPLHEEALALFKSRLGPEHPATLTTMNNLALAYQAAGRLEEALPLLEETLALQRAKLGPEHPDTLNSMNNLASAYYAAGRLDQALPLFEEAATGVEKRRFQHEYAGPLIANAIGAYEGAAQLDRAEVWRRKWLAHVKDTAGPQSLPYAGELAALGLNLLRQEKWREAEAVLRECLAIRQKQQAEAWTTFETQFLLGESLLGQEKYAEAEPLLRSGYEGLKARQNEIPQPVRAQRLIEAVDRLIARYLALNRAEDVQSWQAEKDRLSPTPPPK
ncbi:MAG: tetratricopeptide repeat protein [Pirellulales bacterium]|nr:tetratricopeptide repeat protein [Pirellulales bacterium]